jgi:purine nucleosidase
MTRKIIIDTDPGQDDAAAIMLALGSPELDILGITTVAGNVPLALTRRNALRICELAGRTEMRVFSGAVRPMLRKLVTAEYVHGPTGLDGPDLPEPKKTLEAKHGVDYIIDTLRAEEPGTVTLCTLGPLTNIALALKKAPEIAGRVRELVMMGGGFFEGGNITPAAEFNVYVDPEAAAAVFKAGIPIVMMPLDVTHKVLTLKSRVEKLRAIGSRPAKALVEMLDFFERFDVEKYGSDGGPLHDPTVIAYLLKPELFAGRNHNALVMKDVDADGFFTLLTERVGRL